MSWAQNKNMLETKAELCGTLVLISLISDFALFAMVYLFPVTLNEP